MGNSIQFKSVLLPGLIASAVILSGCGGSGSDSDSSTDPVDSTSSRGLITGFGSVYVNGVKYETDDAEFEVDDDKNSAQDDLRVGMLVTVTGEVDDNGKTGHASHIKYENELKGPISDVTPNADPTIKTLTVLGREILVNADTTFDDDHGFSFDNMAVGDVVEVSGFTTENGITATHIEKQDDDDEIEITGSITDLTDSSFKIHGFNIAYDSNTELDDDIVLVEGLYVEVEGVLDGAGTTLLAEEIEAEDEGLGDDDRDEAEVEGVISDYDDVTETFKIQGQTVDASTAELKPASLVLADGLTVEAEGSLVGGVLIAEEIEQKGRKIKINATLSDVGSDTVTFTFNGTDIVVRVNQQTELEDDINDDDNLLLTNLSAGDYVEMEAFSDGSGDINAIELERKNPDEVKIQAPVEAFDEATEMVTLLGISFDLTNVGATGSYEDDDDNSLTASAFYAELTEGVFIKIKDDDSNGVFDKAELED